MKAKMKSKEKRRMPVRTATAVLHGADYEGWEFTFRTNPPLGLWGKGAAMATSYDESDPSSSSRVVEGMMTLLDAVIMSWNFVDEEGNDLPCNRDGLDRLPLDLIQRIFERVNEVISNAPLVSSGK